MFWTYALYSESADLIYVGQTNNLEVRLDQHNGLSEFTYWTNRHKPWKLLYWEIFATRKEAMGREKFLKSGQGRQFLRIKLGEAGWGTPEADRFSASGGCPRY